MTKFYEYFPLSPDIYEIFLKYLVFVAAYCRANRIETRSSYVLVVPLYHFP